MSGKRRLTKSFKGLDVLKLDRPRQIRGLLGLNNNGTNQVEVPNRAGYVWVRLRDHLSEVIQAYNSNVSPVYDLPVFVTRDSDDPTRYIVVGRDTAQYQNWGAGAAYLPRHANQHSFSDDAGAAGDVVWVFGRQFMPFLGYPSGSFGAGNIIISPYTFYSQNQQWIYAGNTGTADIVAYKPTGSNARVVLVYVDEYGNPQVSPGSYFAATITGTSQIINYLPTLPSGTFPISAVRLVSGTSVINWSNLYDIRPFYSESISVLGGTDGGGGGGGIPERSLPIYDDHIFKVTGTLIDFTDNISVVVTGSVAFVSSVASGGGGIPERSLPIQDDSVFRVTGTAISFDKDLIVTVSGTVAHVEVPAGTFASGSHTHPAGATAIQVYEDNVFQATGSLVGFNDRLAVAVTGTNAYVRVTDRDSSIIWSTRQQTLVGGNVGTLLSSLSTIGMYEGSNPVISPGDEDVNMREFGNVLYEPHEVTRRYKTTYTGYSGTYPGTEHVFYAYSEDGKVWTKNSVNPIITVRLGEDPYVLKSKDIYYLFCEDKSDGGQNRIRRYQSIDFENWTDDGQCSGVDAQSPVVWKEDGTWYLLYEKYPTPPNDIRFATSIDGLTWSDHASNPVIAVADVPWGTDALVPSSLTKIDGIYYFFYFGLSGTSRTAGMATSTDLINWTDNGKAPLKDLSTDINLTDIMPFYDSRITFLYGVFEQAGIFRGYPVPPNLSISNDVITISSDWHLLSAQSGNSDNLSSITGTSTAGQFLVLQPNSGHTITVKHATGNIYLNNEQPFDLSGEKSILLFYDGTNWSDLSPKISGTSSSSAPSIPTYPAIYEKGSFVATGTAITFDGNVDISASGAFVSILFPTTTYQRVAQPNPLNTITGSMWQTPERVYASGSLAVFLNGLIQVSDTDYREQFFVSGTYQYLKEVPTGTVHMIMYGIPCIVQTQPGTGGVSAFALLDSNDVLLLDSNSVQLLDSNG